MSVVQVNRPPGVEATEAEELLEQAFEMMLWRRGDWRQNVSKRLVHIIALLQGMPMDSFSKAERIVEGGIWQIHLTVRK